MTLKDTTNCMGYVQIPSAAVAQKLSPPVGATMAMLQCEGQAIRWRDDGVAPGSASGMRLQVGQTLEYDGDLSKIMVIEESPSAKINVSYYS